MSELPFLCLFSQLSSLGLCILRFSYSGIWPWRLFLSGHQLPPYGPQLVLGEGQPWKDLSRTSDPPVVQR